MGSAAFLLLSVFAAVCAAGVVASRNAVNAAMCLLLCLVGVAGLFILLDAFLLAFLLLLVYAGAVVSLFLFIIMLLGAHGGMGEARRGLGLGAGFGAAALIGAGLAALVLKGRLPPTPPVFPVGAPLKTYAYELFTAYLLPVEVVGFLLLMAMIGVVVLSRREAPPP
jgi:NADH-quinone oxidoreductase subunit J